MFEYISQAQSAARRINSRLAKLTKELGRESRAVNDIMSKMQLYFPDNIVFKGDLPQIMKPGTIFNNPEQNEALEKLDKQTPTYGEFKKEYLGPYERFISNEEFFQGMTQEEVKKQFPFVKYVNIVETIPQALSVLYANQYTSNSALKGIQIMKTKGHRRTYQELEDMEKLADISQEETKETEKERLNVSHLDRPKLRRPPLPGALSGTLKKFAEELGEEKQESLSKKNFKGQTTKGKR